MRIGKSTTKSKKHDEIAKKKKGRIGRSGVDLTEPKGARSDRANSSIRGPSRAISKTSLMPFIVASHRVGSQFQGLEI